ncbi:HdeD family acid-resistance protein [Nonomuraea sp. MCN248]|uniref:HdeD family acid-resistance protein n=1 Tax=Nonomuraea corallina TaxID=2989783 RepID=A0ABT4SH00_9ACTN|nr:HdeD family acid-resistance protein [Nonomuraea corallina]MDA0636482.1 HdeD family acid-resistance protein [Nonomuraea corallina]
MEHLARTWWLPLIRGIAAIIFGVLAVIWPGITLLVLVTFFGAYAIVNGVFAIFTALRHEVRSRIWAIVVGVLSILAGFVAFAWPGITSLALLYVIAIWAIFSGLAEIVDGIQLRKIIDREWTLILGGVLSVVFGVLLLIWPAAGMLSLVWLIGLFAILYGITLITLAFRLKKLGPQTV